MSKKSKKQKRKEEAGRLGAIRRRIEDHQNKIGARVRDQKVAYQEAENIHDDSSGNDDVLAVDYEDKRGLESSSDDEAHHLWVFEPADLDDMSVEQVDEIWKHREQLCGSKEAAAEALAIVEAGRSQVPSATLLKGARTGDGFLEHLGVNFQRRSPVQCLARPGVQ